MKYRVIALVGPLASGKGTLIELLQEKGYESVSLSDEVREKASIWGLTPTRENLQNVGDKLRKSFGLSILAELVGQKIAKNPKVNFVIDGVRNPGELQYLKKEFDAYSIGITASSLKKEKDREIRSHGKNLKKQKKGIEEWDKSPMVSRYKHA